MFISLETIKKHLNIDKDFMDDDAYLISLEGVAEEAVKIDTGRELSECVDDEGNLFPALRHAMLLLIGTFYLHRESVDSTNLKELPQAYQYLLDLHRSYECYG